MIQTRLVLNDTNTRKKRVYLMYERKPFRNFRKREPSLSTEQKVKKFIIRNSQNGFFTKVSTISYKFDVSEDRMWGIVGELLSEGLFESIHDQYSGEMKLCEIDKTYTIMDSERKRKRDKFRAGKKAKSKKVRQKSNPNS